MYEYSFLLNVSEEETDATIFDLATEYDFIHENNNEYVTIISEKREYKEKRIKHETFMFLKDIDFIDSFSNRLTDQGKRYFELLYILNDSINSKGIIRQALIRNPIVNLIGQVFYGRGKITKEQLCNLLNYHCIANWTIKNSDIHSLLVLLNKYSIVTYDKKNNVFYLRDPIQPDQQVKQYYINPTTPFSNIYNLRRALRSCKGDIYWIDKHFRKEGLEIILDGLPFEGVNRVTIISGKENITQSAKSDFESLKIELGNRSVSILWRYIDDPAFKWHDRWIVGSNICYNIPPVLAIIRGQRAEILKTDIEFDIMPFIDISQDIDTILL